MLLRKLLILIAILLLSLTSFQINYADDYNEDEPLLEVFSPEPKKADSSAYPKIEATAAVVIDTKSGRILYAKNADSRRAMASTTKIMTAILAIENGKLEDKVKISKRAASIRGSIIKLRSGEELTLKQLLYGLMLKSGNDAAIAIAEHIGGSVENFAVMMNEKARDLGLKNTAFKNPHGLDADGHYTTAFELAQIARYALKNPAFSKIVGTQNISTGNRDLHTTNEMLGSYQGADGVKTGYTGNAGRCLVTSATRGNMRIISVVLNCSSRAKRAQSSKSILDYAFNNYQYTRILEENHQMRSIQVKRGRKEYVRIAATNGIEMPLTKEEKNSLRKEISMYKNLNAPVYEGVEVGTIRFFVNGSSNPIAESVLVTKESVPAKTFSDYWNKVLGVWYNLIRMNI